MLKKMRKTDQCQVSVSNEGKKVLLAYKTRISTWFSWYDKLYDDSNEYELRNWSKLDQYFVVEDTA